MSAGTDSVITSVRAKKSKIVIVAADASEGTMKKVTDKCAYYGVECIVFGTCESVGNAIGKGLTACVSVTDGNLASALKKHLLRQTKRIDYMAKIKISAIAKDLGVDKAEVLELLKKFGSKAKSAQSSIMDNELDIVFEYFTQKNQVEEFDFLLEKMKKTGWRRKRKSLLSMTI